MSTRPLPCGIGASIIAAGSMSPSIYDHARVCARCHAHIAAEHGLPLLVAVEEPVTVAALVEALRDAADARARLAAAEAVLQPLWGRATVPVRNAAVSQATVPEAGGVAGPRRPKPPHGR